MSAEAQTRRWKLFTFGYGTLRNNSLRVYKSYKGFAWGPLEKSMAAALDQFPFGVRMISVFQAVGRRARVFPRNPNSR